MQLRVKLIYISSIRIVNDGHVLRINADPGRLRGHAALTKIDHIQEVVTLGQRRSETDG